MIKLGKIKKNLSFLPNIHEYKYKRTTKKIYILDYNQWF